MLRIKFNKIAAFGMLMAAISINPMAQAESTSSDRFAKPKSQISQEELNAISLLAEETKTIYFSASAVAQIASEISSIKKMYTEVEKINDFAAIPTPYSELLIGFTDSTQASLLPVVKKVAQIPDEVKKYMSGLADISSAVSSMKDVQGLMQAVPVSSIGAHYSVGPRSPLHILYAMAELETVVNVKALAASLKIGNEIRYIEGNGMMGDGNHIKRMVVDSQTVSYVFSIGGGDCPAGCTQWTNYRFKLNTKTGQIVKLGVDHGFPR